LKEEPNKEELFDLITKLPIKHIAEKYNVCVHTVTRWCRINGFPSTQEELKVLRRQHGVDTEFG
jgi:uncharacterized protein YjcR